MAVAVKNISQESADINKQLNEFAYNISAIKHMCRNIAKMVKDVSKELYDEKDKSLEEYKKHTEEQIKREKDQREKTKEFNKEVKDFNDSLLKVYDHFKEFHDEYNSEMEKFENDVHKKIYGSVPKGEKLFKGGLLAHIEKFKADPNFGNVIATRIKDKVLTPFRKVGAVIGAIIPGFRLFGSVAFNLFKAIPGIGLLGKGLNKLGGWIFKTSAFGKWFSGTPFGKLFGKKKEDKSKGAKVDNTLFFKNPFAKKNENESEGEIESDSDRVARYQKEDSFREKVLKYLSLIAGQEIENNPDIIQQAQEKGKGLVDTIMDIVTGFLLFKGKLKTGWRFVTGMFKSRFWKKLGIKVLRFTRPITKFFSSIGKFFGPVTSFFSSMSKFAGPLAKFASIASKFTKFIPVIGSILSLAIDGFLGVQKSADWLGEEKGNTTAGKVTSGIAGALAGDGPGVFDEGSALSKTFNVGMGALKGAGVGMLLAPILGPVGPLIGAGIGALLSAIGGEKISNALYEAWEGIKSFFGWIGDGFIWLGDFLSESWSSFMDMCSSMIDSIVDAYNNVCDGIKSFFSWIGNGFTWIGNYISEKWTAFKNVCSSIVNRVVGVYNSICDGIKSFFSWIGDTVMNIWTPIENTFNNIKSGFVSIWGKIEKTAKLLSPSNLISVIGKNISKWANGLVKSVIGLFGINLKPSSELLGIWNTIKSHAEWLNPKTLIKKIAEKLGESVGTAAEAIKNFFGFDDDENKDNKELKKEADKAKEAKKEAEKDTKKEAELKNEAKQIANQFFSEKEVGESQYLTQEELVKLDKYIAENEREGLSIAQWVDKYGLDEARKKASRGMHLNPQRRDHYHRVKKTFIKDDELKHDETARKGKAHVKNIQLAQYRSKQANNILTEGQNRRRESPAVKSDAKSKSNVQYVAPTPVFVNQNKPDYLNRAAI